LVKNLVMRNKQTQLSENHLERFGGLSIKSVWLSVGSILSTAIVFSGSPVQAEGRSTVLSANVIPANQNQTMRKQAISNSDEAALSKVSLNALEESLLNPSEKLVHPQNLKQPSLELVESFTENTEPTESAQSVSSTDLFSQGIAQGIQGIVQDNEFEPANSTIESANLEPIELSFPADPIMVQAEPTTPSSEPLPTGTTTEGGWQFSVQPYFFVPLDVNADVTVAGRSTSFDFGLGDILNLDRAFDAGLRLEAQRDRLGFILDGFYISASDSGGLGRSFSGGSLLQFAQRTSPDRLQQFAQRFDPARLQQFLLQRFGAERLQQIVQTGEQIALNTPVRVTADGRVSVRQITVDAAVSYRVVDTSLNDSPEETNFYPRLVIAPILGVRTNSLRQVIEIDTVRIDNLPIPDDRLPVIDNREFRFSRTLVEPMIGAQFGLGLSDRVALGLRGDVSGFNIGADQNLTWNLLAGAEYRFSRLASLQLGYRFNSFDFEDGEGFRRARLNLRQNGLWLSAKFQF
jgi:hypothetical protein